MSNYNKKIAEQIIELWQKQLQDNMKNPQMINLLSQQFVQFEEIIRNIYAEQQSAGQEQNPDISSARSPQYNDAHDKLSELAERIELLESEIRQLKKANTRSSKNRK